MENSEGSLVKTKYFSTLALRNLRSARMLKEGKVLGKDPGDIWRNVSEHCLVQTAAVNVLAELLDLSFEKRKILNLSAMIHDWDKKYQTEGLKRINKIVQSGEISNEESGRLKYEFFEESELHNAKGMQGKGVDPEIINLATADGHTALKRFTNGATLEEKIIHYTGSITNEDRIVSLDERINNLEKNERYKDMNDYGKNLPWTNGKPLYELQREVGHKIEKELVKKLIESGKLEENWKNLLKDSTKLPQFVAYKIEQNWSTQK